MAELPLNEAIPRFKTNEDRFDRFSNGGDATTWVTSGGTTLPSISKFLKDKDSQINVGAGSILSAATAAKTAAESASALAIAAHLGVDKRYLGSKTVDPTVDNQGEPLLVGSTYWNSALSPQRMRVYQGAGAGLGWTDSTTPDGSITRAKLATGLRRMMERTFTPFDYGAVGNGTTNDTAAIQAAFNALKAAGGGTLDLTGDFRIIDGIDMSNAVDIRVISNAGKIFYDQTSEAYFHGFRVNGASKYVTFENLEIYSPSSLVRGQTGFAIQVSGASFVSIKGCHFKDIASACVWIDNTANIIVEENSIEGAKADGIHLSDGCTQAVINGNVINGTQDDAIAVVRDVGGAIPNSIAITGNEIQNVLHGHGVVLISCDQVTVSGNTITNTAAAGIGNYAWFGSSDFAKGLLITGNRIYGSGQNAQNVNNCCNILLQACQDSFIVGNHLSHPGKSNGIGEGDVSNIRVTGCFNSLIMGNYCLSSENYGVHTPDSLGAGQVNKVFVTDNRFENIVISPIRMAPVGLGEVAIAANLFINSAYISPYIAVYIANAGANRVSLLRNNAHGPRTAIVADPATCTNVASEDNSPVSPLGYNPNGRNGGGGNFTASSSTGTHWTVGGTVFVNTTITITTRGGTGGLLLAMPFPIHASSGYDFHWVDVTTGAFGIAEIHPEFPQLIFLHGTDPTGDGKVIKVRGWFVPG